jgi:hypothetical protein
MGTAEPAISFRHLTSRDAASCGLKIEVKAGITTGRSLRLSTYQGWCFSASTEGRGFNQVPALFSFQAVTDARKEFFLKLIFIRSFFLALAITPTR